MKLNRTPSLHDRDWRNAENENWQNIEQTYSAFAALEEFLKGFDGRQMIQQSYNLFNKATVVDGGLNRTNGEINSNDFYTSDFIPVKPGHRLQIKPSIGVTVMYDENFNYINNIPSSDFPFLLPGDARFIRTQMSYHSLDEKYVYLGDEDLSYADYGYSYMPEFVEFVKSIAGESEDDYINLFNKNNVIEGQLSPTTGNVIGGDYWVTDYIEVIPNKEIQLRPAEGTLAIYDSNKNFIKAYLSGEGPKMVPPDGKYIRNQMSKPSLDGKYIYMGTEDMPYYPYGEGRGTQQDKHLKILCVGNSYSNDTFWMLKDIVASAGKQVTVGVSHFSGGTLSQVYDAIDSNGTVTTYNKFTLNNGHEENTNYNARDIITDEDWDYIFFQQASTSAMDYSSYQPHLGNLVNYVRNNATNPNVKLGMNMPWVRPISNSSIGTPEKQLEVNADIVDACQQAMFDEELDVFIPTGTAIMNGRGNDYLADISNELTRDGSHLDEGIGRYLAALTAFHSLYPDNSIGGVSYTPSNTNGFHAYLAKVAAKKAVIDPFKVTET